MKTIEDIQFLILDLEGNIIFSDDVIFEVEKLYIEVNLRTLI